MADVARAAGLSRAAVSLALRDDPQIPESTRQRVRAAARRLGYAPHPLVSALMATRRRGTVRFRATLAFLTGHGSRDGWRKNSPAYAAFFTGARARAKVLGYALEDFWLRDPALGPGRLQRILHARGIHGLLLAPQPIEHDTLPEFDWAPFAVLAVGYSVRTPDFHRISHDYFRGMALALAQCRAKGYRRIGFFLDRRVSRVVGDLWHAAWLAEQKTAPGAEAVEPLLAARWDDPAIVPWLRAERPDVLVCLDPWRLQEIGHLPRGLATVSLNADESPRPVAGISRDFDLLGAAAVDRLISLLHGNSRGSPARAQTVLLEGVWSNDAELPPRRA